MGSLHNIDFGVLWASWGTGFRADSRYPDSGPKAFDGFRGVRFCSRSFDGTVSGNRVPGTRSIKKLPGQGFRQLPCTSKVYYCTLKVYFCTLKVCVCTLRVYLLCFARR